MKKTLFSAVLATAIAAGFAMTPAAFADDMKKDTMSMDGMSKDSTKKDGMKKDDAKKDSMKKTDGMSDKKDSMKK